MTNYYHILGLNESASPLEIKAAFKRLAVQFHPDKHPGRPEMEDKFKEINEAHQILSDPYEKARFDLRLKYQQYHNYQEEVPTDYRTPRRKTPPRNYRAAPIDYKENAKATLYAFGITFSIALLVMIGVWSNDLYKANQLEKLLASRRVTYETAQTAFERGDYRKAFDIMSSFDFFKQGEKDIRLFKDKVIVSISAEGDRLFKQGQYDKSIKFFRLLLDAKHHLPNYDLKEKLAIAYRKVGKQAKALEILNNLLVQEYRAINTLATIGEIYHQDLKESTKALEQYQLGSYLIRKKYKAYYGDGYALVINGEQLPKSHYRLYAGLADLYLDLSDFEMAQKAALWNKYVWPDSTQGYITTARALMKENKTNQACEEYFEASRLGWRGSIPASCFN